MKHDFSFKDTIIDKNNKKVLKIIKNFNYKLGKKSITKYIKSILLLIDVPQPINVLVDLRGGDVIIILPPLLETNFKVPITWFSL